MTDDIKTMLQLAAKAAGICAIGFHEKLGVEHIDGSDDSPYTTFWNPLEDDGDALQLAVRLSLRSECNNNGIAYVWRGSELVVTNADMHDNTNDSRCAATRLAIVRAAAEIGKGMNDD